MYTVTEQKKKFTRTFLPFLDVSQIKKPVDDSSPRKPKFNWRAVDVGFGKYKVALGEPGQRGCTTER
jgi:hypothetical protein